MLPREFDDYKEWNDNGSELDEYAEFDKDRYRNFDEVKEYHNDYDEFPDSEHPPIRKSDKDEPVSMDHARGITTSQVLAATVVALVVVTGIFIPILDSKDVSVYIEGSVSNGMVYYYAEVYHYDENIPYYAVLLKDGSIMHQQAMVDGVAKYSEENVDENHNYTVEVRSGSPPLYVLEKKSLNSKIWVDLDHLNVTSTDIDYGLYLYGDGATATVSLYDTESSENVFSKDIAEGYDSDVIDKLQSGHTYYFTVGDQYDTYYFQEVTTPQSGNNGGGANNG